MEKYAKLMKGLEMCAGPDCCEDACPYYGETRGGKTCRAWLLNDAAAAIANEEAGSETLQELLHNTEAERDKLAAEVDDLEAAANTLRAERDELRVSLKMIADEKENLRVERDSLRCNLAARCHDETDRPSACDKTLVEEVGKLIAQAKYQEGRADALAAIVERCSFGGWCCHE